MEKKSKVIQNNLSIDNLLRILRKTIMKLPNPGITAVVICTFLTGFHIFIVLRWFYKDLKKYENIRFKSLNYCIFIKRFVFSLIFKLISTPFFYFIITDLGYLYNYSQFYPLICITLFILIFIYVLALVISVTNFNYSSRYIKSFNIASIIFHTLFVFEIIYVIILFGSLILNIKLKTKILIFLVGTVMEIVHIIFILLLPQIFQYYDTKSILNNVSISGNADFPIGDNINNTNMAGLPINYTSANNSNMTSLPISINSANMTRSNTNNINSPSVPDYQYLNMHIDPSNPILSSSATSSHNNNSYNSNSTPNNIIINFVVHDFLKPSGKGKLPLHRQESLENGEVLALDELYNKQKTENSNYLDMDGSNPLGNNHQNRSKNYLNPEMLKFSQLIPTDFFNYKNKKTQTDIYLNNEDDYITLSSLKDYSAYDPSKIQRNDFISSEIEESNV